MFDQLLITSMYDLNQTIAFELFAGYSYPWEVLPEIGNFIMKLGESLPEDEYVKKRDDIWIARNAKISSTVSVKGPCIIGKNAEIRHCAYIRGNVIIGEDCVVGNSTELKNSLLFNRVQVPHYNYVGDSILGYKSHFGAGVITSNIKSDRTPVVIRFNAAKVDTGLIKVGALIGDNVEVGCNTVLNPGTIVGRSTNIYPLSMVRGYVPANSIYKKKGEVVFKK